jgi:hypothetical protein
MRDGRDDEHSASDEEDVAMDDGQQDEESEYTDDDSEGDLPVLILRCKACASVLCRRGMSVELVADASVSLFSTDFATSATIALSTTVREIGSCACRIIDLSCRTCTRSRPGSRSSSRLTSIGYHVVRPCEECLSGENNGHYYLFHADSVDASPWPLFGAAAQPLDWRSGRLGVFDGAMQPLVLAAADGGDSDGEPLDKLADELLCPICFDVLRAPVRLERCGHTFCEACVTRHVDTHHACPLDRRPACASELAPDERARRAVGRLRVHCRFGCVRPAAFDPPKRGDREADAAGSPPPPRTRRVARADRRGTICSCGEWDCGLAPHHWVPARVEARGRDACGVTRALSKIGAHERRCPHRCACLGLGGRATY